MSYILHACTFANGWSFDSLCNWGSKSVDERISSPAKAIFTLQLGFKVNFKPTLAQQMQIHSLVAFLFCGWRIERSRKFFNSNLMKSRVTRKCCCNISNKQPVYTLEIHLRSKKLKKIWLTSQWTSRDAVQVDGCTIFFVEWCWDLREYFRFSLQTCRTYGMFLSSLKTLG